MNMDTLEIQSIKQRFGIIGGSQALNSALITAVKVAPTDLSVLITGESGVGKEFFPQVIHANSARKHNKYIAVNCGAIPEGTIDSELFGHEKGAFTGAVDSRKGYFEEADGGTIFLDEIAELPASTQVRLLRVLQTGEFIRVGSAKVQKTDVRVIAATNVNLQDAISTGKFREDLFYRLSTVPITVPPLRERKEDIYLLFRKFSSDIATRYRMPAITLDESARRVLEEYPWPGNVRQLKNVAEQISAIEETREIDEVIIRKYLPVHNTAPVFLNGKSDMSGDEREILYRILFDMRADISEVKRMLSEMKNGYSATEQPHVADIAGLLPRNTVSIPPHEVAYAESEDVTEQSANIEQTKEQAQREAILNALRRTGGKRKEAAKILYISERTLYRKMKELGIS